MADNRKPNYQPWNEEEFQSDVFVRGMRPLQRWMYRTLLQASFFHSTRPYLPADDKILWVLAGCESRQQWEENNAEILERFSPIEIDGINLLENKRVISDWDRLVEFREIQSEKGRNRATGAPRASGGQFAKPGMPVLLNTSRPPAVAGDSSQINQPPTSHPPAEGEGEVKLEKSKGIEKAGDDETFSNQERQNLGGDWGNMRRSYKAMFNRKPDRNMFERRYLDACKSYGEAVVLSCFDAWAPSIKEWLENVNFGNPLSLFFKKLPDLAADELESQSEDKQQQEQQAAQHMAEQAAVKEREKFIGEQKSADWVRMNYVPPTTTPEIDPEQFLETN